MKITAQRTEEKAGISYRIDVEYDPKNEAECREAFMKLGPFMPVLGFMPPKCECKKDPGRGPCEEKPERNSSVDMLKSVIEAADAMFREAGGK